MYNVKLFKDDLIAGVTVAVVAVPMALAFGVASGLGAAAGLYSAVVAGFLAAVFGGSRFQISGPTGGMVAVLALVVARYGPEKALLAGLMAGIFQAVFGLIKLGKLIKFIPFSVVAGFTAGIAFVIVLGQKDNILGAPLVVAATVLLSLAVRRLSPRLPASLITVVIITLAVVYLKLPVAKLGTIPTSIPLPRLPGLQLGDLRELFKPALVLAALGSIESLLSAVVADGMTADEHHDSNKELIGQGIGNIAAPLFGGMAATGAIARTAVNISAGAKTRFSGVVHSLTILALMVALAPLAAEIPLAVLAGILVVAAVRMVDWEDLVVLYKSSRAALAVTGLTVAVTILVDLVTAVEVGLIAAGALFVYRMSDLGVYREENLLGGSSACEVTPKVDPRITAYRIDGPLFFGAVEKFVKTTTAHPDMRFLILRMRRVPMIDTSGAMALEQINKNLRRQDCQLLISGMQKSVAERLAATGVLAEIGPDNAFAWTREAMTEAQRRLLSGRRAAVTQSGAEGAGQGREPVST